MANCSLREGELEAEGDPRADPHQQHPTGCSPRGSEHSGQSWELVRDPSTIPDKASVESDLEAIRIVLSGTAGDGARDSTGNKATISIQDLH